MKNSSSFSLIELLVVIAIVSILAGVAAPQYRDYTLKAKINRNLHLIESIAEKALITREATGVFPTTLSWNGLTLIDGAVDRVPAGVQDIVNLKYDYHVANNDPNVEIVRIQANLSGLDGIPGYAAPATSTTDSSLGMIRYLIYDTGDGIIKKACGSWYAAEATPEDIPPKYLIGCKCNLANVWVDGVDPVDC